jgi:hypothetical protein
MGLVMGNENSQAMTNYQLNNQGVIKTHLVSKVSVALPLV